MTELEAANEAYRAADAAVGTANQALQAAENKRLRAYHAVEAAKWNAAAAVPVDRTEQQLVSGGPVPGDGSHTEHKPNGQQKDYVVLSPAERAKGFVRPVRDAYRHIGRVICGRSGGRCDRGGQIEERICHFAPGHEGKCGEIGWRIVNGAEIVRLHETGRLGGCDHVTTMGRALAETYARNPSFYSGTFCSNCREHFPVGANGEFIWLENDGLEINRVGT